MNPINSNTVLMINVHEDDVLCFRKEVIDALTAAGQKVVLLYPLGPRYLELENDRVHCETVKMDRHGTNPIKELALFFAYRKAIRKYRPSCVLLYTIKPNIYGSIAARLCKVPYVNNITGIGKVLAGKASLLQRIIKALYRVALKKSNHVFFQNSANHDLFLQEKLCKEEQSSVIPGSGVDLSRFALSEYPSEESGMVFNYIARVMESKGILDYIEMARAIKKTHPECEFNVLGFIEEDEPDTKAAFLKAVEEKLIVYRGNQADVRPFIQRSHAAILPSKYGEGMSNVLLESAATGRALITTDIPGCRDLVANQNGFLFASGDIPTFVRQVESFLALSAEERKEMGLRSRELVESNFSRQIVVDAYLTVVKSIYSENRQ